MFPSKFCRCNDGFQMVGNNNVTCDYQGVWPTILPYCAKVCPDPFKLILHSKKFKQAMYIEKETTALSCMPGYQPSTNATITCGQDGLWQGYSVIPECVPITCLTPATANLIVLGDSIANSTVSFQCVSGYRLIGEPNATCHVDGAWDVDWPHCIEIDCLEPLAIENGLVKYATTLHLSKAEYSCHSGYTLEGDNIVTCGENSAWYPIVPVCIPVRCEKLVEVNNGKLLNVKNSYNYMALTQLVCDRGYVLKGNNETHCTAMGLWEPEVRCATCNQQSLLLIITYLSLCVLEMQFR